MLHRSLAIALGVTAGFSTAALAADQPQPRPPITRIAYVAYYVTDPQISKNFYQDFLGYTVNPLPGDKPEDEHVLAVQINRVQQIRLFRSQGTEQDRLYHFALETPAPEQMAQYLLAAGVPPVRLNQDAHRTGAAPALVDPHRHHIAFVPPTESLPDLPLRREPIDNRISRHLWAVGLPVTDVPQQILFYGEALGCRETWRGSRDGKLLNWVNNRLPEGHDYIQFVIGREVPGQANTERAQQITLRVANVDAVKQTLEARATRTGYARPLEIELGADNRRRINLVDPDGIRIELLETRTVDGRRPQSVYAPPPGQE